MLGSDGYFTQTFDLALIPISKYNRVVGNLVLDVGSEHLLLPHHMVCASAVNHPTCALGCINLQGDLSLGFRYPTLVGSYMVSHIRLWNPNASFASLALRPHISSNNFIIFTHKNKWSIIGMIKHSWAICCISRRTRNNMMNITPMSISTMGMLMMQTCHENNKSHHGV